MGCARVNIGNRKTAQEAAEEATAYDANNLNQYTSIQTGEEAAFVPTFDADGNQTKVKTSTGIWNVVYNAENRPVSFTNSESNTVVECAYDSMGRRAYKKVTVNGSITLHQRYIYRGYLQIAALDFTRDAHPALWYITWDPSQPVATRPLAIQINGTWYSYGWDLTKNICELYGPVGFIANTYTYSPYGKMDIIGNVNQPILWSSEHVDNETNLVYYNYRYYDTLTGLWLSRDIEGETIERNLYTYTSRSPYSQIDQLGLWYATPQSRGKNRRVYIKNEQSDTEESLAEIVGLDKETFNIWAKKDCNYIMDKQQYCSYSVPNVWITANLIEDWVGIGGEVGIAMSRLVQFTPKLVVVRSYKELLENLTEDLWGIILYAHGVDIDYPTYSPEDKVLYYAGDIEAPIKNRKYPLYRQLELMDDIMRATGGRRIAEAHLMQCYSFKDRYIIGKWRETAVISKGYTRMNVCGINIPLT